MPESSSPPRELKSLRPTRTGTIPVRCCSPGRSPIPPHRFSVAIPDRVPLYGQRFQVVNGWNGTSMNPSIAARPTASRAHTPGKKSPGTITTTYGPHEHYPAPPQDGVISTDHEHRGQPDRQFQLVPEFRFTVGTRTLAQGPASGPKPWPVRPATQSEEKAADHTTRTRVFRRY